MLGRIGSTNGFLAYSSILLETRSVHGKILEFLNVAPLNALRVSPKSESAARESILSSKPAVDSPASCNRGDR
jgi:hypothetical protein